MANNDLTAKIRIDGDASGATQALSETEKELKSLREAKGSIAVLDRAEAQARELSSEMEAVRQKAQRLETALSEAMSVDADSTLVADLGRQLANAEKEAAKLEKALEKNKSNLVGLRLEAQQAGVNLSRLGDEKIRIEQAARAAEAMSSAFRTLGIKPLKDVVAETERLKAALDTINRSGLSFVDKDRAAAALSAKLAALRSEAGRAGEALGSAAASAQSAGSAFEGLTGRAAAAVTALVGLNSAVNMATDVVKTGAAFETLEARLSSLLGSTEAAKEAMAQIKQLAISTPFEVTALADSFIKLTAFGLQPSVEQMRSLSDTAATLGGGTEALAGVTLALGQAWAKGKLQGEEILQLAERGVPVWDVLAKATGKNTAELQKMSEAGELGRGTILKLIDALGKMNSGASEKLMATFSGAVSNAKDALAEFYDMIAKAGVLEFLTNQMQDLLAEFERMKQTGELQQTAKEIANSFVAIGEGVRSAIEAVNAMSGVIKLSVEVWAAWKLAGLTLIPILAGVGRQAAITAAETTTLAAASNSAAVAAGRLATGLRLLKGLTLVGLVEGVISLGAEFFRAKKAAEEGERAVRKMLAPAPDNGTKDAIKAIVTETEAARFKLTEYQRAMLDAQGQGKTTGDALGDMVKKADISTVKGITELLNGLRSVEQGAMATGQQIQASIQDRLTKMSASELRDFGLMAEMAFRRGDISAQQLATTLNGQVDAALKDLGTGIEVSAGGMTAKFIEVSQQIGVVEASYDRLKASGQDASAVLKAAFEGGLNTAKSVTDLEGLAVSIRQAGEAGRLSKRDVADFLDTIQAKVDAIKPGINSLAEAFKTLGMTSPAELRKTARSAEEAYNVIKNSADFTTAGINNTKEAFKRYAEASIAANGGVASEMVKAQAWVQGYSVEVDNMGKSMLKAKASTDEMVGGIAIAADQMESAGAAASDAAEQIDSLSAAMTRNATVVVPGVGGSFAATGVVDTRAEALRQGAAIENVDEVVRRSNVEIERLFAKGKAPEAMQSDTLTAIVREVMRGLNISQDGQRQPTKTIRLELGAGDTRTVLHAESEAAADSFLKILEAAGMRAAR